MKHSEAVLRARPGMSRGAWKAAFCLLAVVLAGCAPEKPPQQHRDPGDPNQLLSAWVGNGKFVDKVEMRKIDLAAGEKLKPQAFPIPISGYVVSGKIRFQVQGETEQLLSPGDAYFKPANTRIQKFEAVDGPAQCVESYLLGNKDQSIRVN